MAAQTNHDKHSSSDCIPMVAFARALARDSEAHPENTGTSGLAGQTVKTAATDQRLITASRHLVANF
jgi:hypothetical protein